MTARRWGYAAVSALAIGLFVLSIAKLEAPNASAPYPDVEEQSEAPIENDFILADSASASTTRLADTLRHTKHVPPVPFRTSEPPLPNRTPEIVLRSPVKDSMKSTPMPSGFPHWGSRKGAAPVAQAPLRRQQVAAKLDSYARTHLGHLASYIPGSMDYDAVTVVIARVEAGAAPQADLTRTLTTGRPEPGSVVVAPITTSIQMEAHLVDPDSAFFIRTLTQKPLQLVDANGATEWSWAVTPIVSGAHPLRLTVDQVLRIAGAQTSKTITVGTRQVQVRTSALSVGKRWLRIHLAYLVTALFLPSLAWLGKEVFQHWLANRNKSTATAP